MNIILKAQRMQVEAFSQAHLLDPKTAVWLITVGAWERLLKSLDQVMIHGAGPDSREVMQKKTFLGLPVRITSGDDPDTPDIELVMRPMLR